MFLLPLALMAMIEMIDRGNSINGLVYARLTLLPQEKN
jgi:hypothetical protein